MKQRFSSFLIWVNRDGKLIVSARGVRTFGQGFIAVMLAIYLDRLGFSVVQIGAVLSAGVAGSAFYAFLVGIAAERVGKRRIMTFFGVLSAVIGVLLFLVDSYVAILVFAFFGNLVSGPEGPMQPIEQSILPDTAPREKRTDLFAVYGMVARFGTALGSLAAGTPALLEHGLGMDAMVSLRVMFLAFAALQLIGVAFYLSLSSKVEGEIAKRQWTNPLKLRSRRLILTLTALFSVDHFAGSMLGQSLVAYFFATRFGIELSSLAYIFFISNTLTTVSLWVAAKLANRIGLLNTMVFTHIPSNLFLIAIMFAPAGWVAVLFWQLRSSLSQMDVPTRESYTMAIVGPQERVAMSSVTLIGRSGSSIAGPSAATALWNALSAAAPFFVCGVMKIAYDVTLYFMFRNVKPPEEAERAARKAASAKG